VTEFDVYVTAADYDFAPQMADEALQRVIDARLRVLRLDLVEIRETRETRPEHGLCLVRTVVGEEARG
jgi:hypothetical protein